MSNTLTAVSRKRIAKPMRFDMPGGGKHYTAKKGRKTTKRKSKSSAKKSIKKWTSAKKRKK